MFVAVVSDFHTGSRKLLHGIREFCCLRSDEEESCFSVILLKRSEDSVFIESRAVIKGQGNHRAGRIHSTLLCGGGHRGSAVFLRAFSFFHNGNNHPVDMLSDTDRVTVFSIFYPVLPFMEHRGFIVDVVLFFQCPV